GHDLGVPVVGRGFDDGASEAGRVRALENAAAHETGLRPQLHDQSGIRWRGDPTGAEEGYGQVAGLGQLLDEPQRGTELLRPAVAPGWMGLGDPANVAGEGPKGAHGLFDVARPRLTLGTDHGRSLGDAPERLTQVGGAAYEGNGEGPLVDVVDVV